MKRKKIIILFAAFLVGIAQESQAMMRRFAILKLFPQVGAERTYTKTMPLLAANSYKVLGVMPSDSISKIKENYRQLIIKHHPDAGGNADDFRQIREAYQTIMAGKAHRSSEYTSKSTSSDSKNKKKSVKNPIAVEELLKYAKEQNLNSLSSLISLLEEKGKIASIEDFFRKAELIIFAKLLEDMRLIVDHNFFGMLDSLAEQGFQAKDFFEKNKASIIYIAINQLETHPTTIEFLAEFLRREAFTIDEFIQSLIIKFRNQEPGLYALVNKILKQSLMIKPRNQEQKIYTFVNKILKHCYSYNRLEICIIMYESLVKNISLELKNDIENDISIALKKVMKFELEYHVVGNLEDDILSDGFSKTINIARIKSVFESLDTCVAAGFINSFELFKELKEDFENAVIKYFRISQEAGNLLLTFLQSKGVVFDNIFLEQLTTESFIEGFNEELLDLINKNDFGQAYEKMKYSYKYLSAEAKKAIINDLVCRLKNNQPFAMKLLLFALKNNILTTEELFKIKEFISSKNSLLLQFLDECYSIGEYISISVIIQDMEKVGLIKKEQLIDKATKLMRTKLSGDFPNWPWDLGWCVMAVRLLSEKEIINMNDIRSTLEITLPAKFVAILTKKNGTHIHYNHLITVLRFAIDAKFITIESFLNELFNCASLTLEEKEQFKRMLLNS